MLDISRTVTSGLVDKLRFMGHSKEESVEAARGIMRHDVTLSDQLNEYHRRRYKMNEYRDLIQRARNEAGDFSSGAIEQHHNNLNAKSTSSAASTRQASLDNQKDMLFLCAQDDTKPTTTTAAAPPQPSSDDATRDLSISPTKRDTLAPFTTTTATPVQQQPVPLAQDVSTILFRYDSVSPSQGDKSSPRRGPGNGGDDSLTKGSTTQVSPRPPAMDPLANSVMLRAALSKNERYLPCFYCAKDVLHDEFATHLQTCKQETDLLLRKAYLNPLRYVEFVPQIPPPALDCTENEFDDYAMECSKSLGKSLVECLRCKRKYNIHEIQKHSAKCLGRSSSEILGNYTSYIPSKK